MKYKITKSDTAVKINAGWNKSCWRSIKPLELKNFMGERPTHFPKVRAKLLYDEKNIYVIFRVEDNYVLAKRTKHNSFVSRDSCVEFFFSPGQDGYFNLEMNCSGVMLMHYQSDNGANRVNTTPDEGKLILRKSTLSGLIYPEISTPTTWVVEYALPYMMLEKYVPVVKPIKGVVWRANFYKCGDETSHRHWLTWNKVDLPKPDFHRPEFFGEVEFE